MTFDDGSWSFNFISNVYKDIDESKKVSIIISSRIPEYYREMRNLNNIPSSIYNFDENISEENAKRIVIKLNITKRTKRPRLSSLFLAFKDPHRRANEKNEKIIDAQKEG